MVPYRPDTLHLIDAQALATMKDDADPDPTPAAVRVVDEAAVADALASGKLAGYAADVFEMEEWARTDRPRVIPQGTARGQARAHCSRRTSASAVDSVRLAIEVEAATNILQVLRGEVPQGCDQSAAGEGRAPDHAQPRAGRDLSSPSSARATSGRRHVNAASRRVRFSQQLRKLEVALGTRLIERDARGCLPTPEGTAFQAYAGRFAAT